jgi:hypothetical protein
MMMMMKMTRTAQIFKLSIKTTQLLGQLLQINLKTHNPTCSNSYDEKLKIRGEQ